MSRQKGSRVEQQAEAWLASRGLKLLERNYSSRGGEIDLIMRDKQTLVFIEVRYRRSSCFGSSAESVDWRKQQKLVATAQLYLQANPGMQNLPCRFDVIACSPGDNAARIDWITGAFEP